MPRHVVIVTTSYPEREGDPGGHFVQAEARALAASGARVTVLAPGGARPCTKGVSVLGLGGGRAFGWPGVAARLRENPLRAVGVASFCWRARQTLVSLAPTEVIAHWLVPSLLITSGVAVPVTAVAHGSDVAWLTRLPRAVVSQVVDRWLSRGVRLRFVSQSLRDELERGVRDDVRGRLAAASRVEASPIDVAGTADRCSARKRLGLGDRFVALSVGRLVRDKHVDHVLARAPVPEGTRWVVIGDGPELEPLRRRHPEVEFKGALPRPLALEWISAADVLVCGSQREGAPTVIREARRLGTPVWTSNVGDVAHWAKEDPGISVLACLDPGRRRGVTDEETA